MVQRLDTEGWVNAKGAASSTNSVDDEVLAEVDCSAATKASIYSKTTLGITGTLSVKLQISPLAQGDMWVDSGVVLTAGVNLNDVTKSTGVLADVAKRMRLLLTVSPSVGSVDLVLLAK